MMKRISYFSDQYLKNTLNQKNPYKNNFNTNKIFKVKHSYMNIEGRMLKIFKLMF